ncbi:MAG: hypothetical protein V1789_08505 [PVC group bacterium]
MRTWSLIAGILISIPGLVRGEPAAVPSPAPDKRDLIVEKIAGGASLTGEDISSLESGAVIRVDDTRQTSRFIEGEPGEEKKVYLLKVEKEEGEMRQMLDMQKSLLRSQLALLKALEVIVRHQAVLERRLARNENMLRDMTMGDKDVAYGLNMSRIDTSSISAEVGDLSEMTVEIGSDIKDIQDTLSGME